MDGTVSEDSDCLLFGSKRVIRHLFSTKQSAQEITAARIYKEMSLTRQDLITMALFMGSDYTPGVKGIAGVNAIEIINSFGSSCEDLAQFKRWVSVEQQIMD